MIYGAQGIALGAYEAIHSLCPARRCRCFLVTERGDNMESLSGVPVLELVPFASALSQEEKQDMEILIATPEDVMPEIEKSLDEQGLPCHVRLTAQRWAQLLGYHHAAKHAYIPLQALPVGHRRADLHVFMARSVKDRPLENVYAIPEWVTPIQVGAALCEERVADLLDCEGGHISGKNGNYSELTALYWIWKNRLCVPSAGEGEAYYGLAHYRRILDLTEDDILRLSGNGVDAVLPYPMPYEPDIREHHKRYLKEEDWRAVLQALSEIWPEYAEALPKILEQRYLYNYNIVLARKHVLKGYCEWLFPILLRVEGLSVPKGAERADRYIGYVGETLLTLYFMYHGDRLNIVHTGCRFLT